MKTFYIFRHGETFATKLKRWYGYKLYSAPILEEGKPSILRLANYLKNIPESYSVSSPFLRCRQTAEIVSDITGQKFETDRRIREYEYFELPYFLKRRVLSFINDMENSNHKNILICTHAIILEMLIQFLTKGRISFRDRIAAPLPGVLTIIKNKELEQINFN
jgi:broad specificity phosphatase PhoE